MIELPYLIFLGDVTSNAIAKTAFGIRDWVPGASMGQWRLPGCTVDLRLPDMTPGQARQAGAKTLLIGAAPIGGALPDHWRQSVLQALGAGLHVVSGLHIRLANCADIREAAERANRKVWDVRHTERQFPVATGRKRSGKRLLTVGTDCSLGKKYTALKIARCLQARGLPAKFRATGQTGIMIAGEGIAMDSVVADFVAGAAECLSPDAESGHWDIIEGQGALFHPAYAGVTLGLLHGSQPDALVLCHDPTRETINLYPDYPIPDLETAAQRYIESARLTNPAARLIGVCLNTSRLPEDEARAIASGISGRLDVPCADPMRFGIEAIVDRIAQWPC